MTSSRAATTCALLSRGVRFEYGSLEEKLARIGLERERRIEYLKTVVMVNAIIGIGNNIAAAVTGSPNNQLGGDKLTKSLELLRDLLVPEEGEQKEEKAKSAREKLEREIAKGPLKVRPIQSGRQRRKKR